jgi:hypothetical protein
MEKMAVYQVLNFCVAVTWFACPVSVAGLYFTDH